MHFLALFLLQEAPDPAVVQKMALIMIPIIIAVFLVAIVIVMVPCWFILKKAGFSPWLTLINIVPMGTLILLYVLAFAEWKVVPAPPPVWLQPQQPPYPPQA